MADDDKLPTISEVLSNWLGVQWPSLDELLLTDGRLKLRPEA